MMPWQQWLGSGPIGAASKLGVRVGVTSEARALPLLAGNKKNIKFEEAKTISIVNMQSKQLTETTLN